MNSKHQATDTTEQKIIKAYSAFAIIFVILLFGTLVIAYTIDAQHPGAGTWPIFLGAYVLIDLFTAFIFTLICCVIGISYFRYFYAISFAILLNVILISITLLDSKKIYKFPDWTFFFLYGFFLLLHFFIYLFKRFIPKNKP